MSPPRPWPFVLLSAVGLAGCAPCEGESGESGANAEWAAVGPRAGDAPRPTPVDEEPLALPRPGALALRSEQWAAYRSALSPVADGQDSAAVVAPFASDPALLTQRVQAHLRAGELAEAVPLAQTAARWAAVPSKRAAALSQLAQLKERQGDRSAALALLVESHALDPDEAAHARLRALSPGASEEQRVLARYLGVRAPSAFGSVVPNPSDLCGDAPGCSARVVLPEGAVHITNTDGEETCHALGVRTDLGWAPLTLGACEQRDPSGQHFASVSVSAIWISPTVIRVDVGTLTRALSACDSGAHETRTSWLCSAAIEEPRCWGVIKVHERFAWQRGAGLIGHLPPAELTNDDWELCGGSEAGPSPEESLTTAQLNLITSGMRATLLGPELPTDFAGAHAIEQLPCLLAAVAPVFGCAAAGGAGQ